MSKGMLFPDHAHDPGGKVILTMPAGMTGQAQFAGPDGCYRLWLSRSWLPGPLLDFALWIGMNPSVAAANIDDMTVRREINFTRAWGMRGYVKCNVMDYRATNPKDLLKPGVVRCSPDNLSTISKWAGGAAKIIVAWGRLPPALRGHAIVVEKLLRDQGLELWCISTNADGSPRHTISRGRNRVPDNASPIVWREAG